jgi:hypothetical protein
MVKKRKKNVPVHSIYFHYDNTVVSIAESKSIIKLDNFGSVNVNYGPGLNYHGGILGTFGKFISVGMWIRIYFSADPDPDPGKVLNTDPDPGAGSGLRIPGAPANCNFFLNCLKLDLNTKNREPHFCQLGKVGTVAYPKQKQKQL